MSEYHHGEGLCIRCLRNSPISSLLGFILVLIGGGAFCGATIFARRYLIEALDAPHLFPYVDCVVYGLIAAIGVFSVLAYVLCAFSSGWNAKHYFESSRKATCGRCCNMTLITLLVIAILLWTVIASLMSFPVISIALVLRNADRPTLLSMASDIPNQIASEHLALPHDQLPRVKRQPPSFDNLDGVVDEEAERLVSEYPSVNPTNEDINAMASQPINNPQFPADPDFPFESVPAGVDSIPSKPFEATASPTNLPDAVNTNTLFKLKDTSKKVLGTIQNAKALIPCDPTKFDLSYYGLFTEDGQPLMTSRFDFRKRFLNILICAGISVGGTLLLILGYLQIIICTAMNYARMQEPRYYEASDGAEESGALQP